MSFVSFEFALFVILVLAIYYITAEKYRWIVLLVASFVFYGLCGIKYFVYILFIFSNLGMLA